MIGKEPTHEIKIYYREGDWRGSGVLAVHAWAIGLHTHEMEIQAARSRSDIGCIKVLDRTVPLNQQRWVVIQEGPAKQ